MNLVHDASLLTNADPWKFAQHRGFLQLLTHAAFTVSGHVGYAEGRIDGVELGWVVTKLGRATCLWGVAD